MAMSEKNPPSQSISRNIYSPSGVNMISYVAKNYPGDHGGGTYPIYADNTSAPFPYLAVGWQQAAG
jgi:hypothetical protein